MLSQWAGQQLAHRCRNTVHYAVDLTKSPEAGLIFASDRSPNHDLATLLEAIQSTLIEVDQSDGQTGELDKGRSSPQQGDDAITISDEEFILETLWTIKAVEAVRIRDGNLHWCIVLEDNSMATDWFEEAVILGHKLSEYASYCLPLGAGTFVTWHRQWVTSDRVPHGERCDYLNSLLGAALA